MVPDEIEKRRDVAAIGIDGVHGRPPFGDEPAAPVVKRRLQVGLRGETD